MNDLKLTIEGSAGAGKTRLAILLADFLFNHGFHVDTHLLEEVNISEIKETLPLAIDEIKQKSYVTITEKHLAGPNRI